MVFYVYCKVENCLRRSQRPFFFSQFCEVGELVIPLQEKLARFGYNTRRKVEFFWIPTMWWWHGKSYSMNMAIWTFLPSKCDKFGRFFSCKILCKSFSSLSFLSFCHQAMKLQHPKKTLKISYFNISLACDEFNFINLEFGT